MTHVELLPILERVGFVDDSYGNDACPSMRHAALGLKLWIEDEDPECRDSDGYRYALHREKPDANGEWTSDYDVLIETDSARTLCVVMAEDLDIPEVAS